VIHHASVASARSIDVTDAHAGQTLAAVVKGLVEGAAWSKARELCASGRVTIDGTVERDGARRVRAGERIEVDPEGRRRGTSGLSEDDVLHVDDDIIVVRKHPGLLTCPYEDGDKDTLSDRTRALLKRRFGARDPMVGVVQRLDKDTSGVLVFARNMKSKRALEDQLRAHTVVRRYLAICHGLVPSGRIESEIVQNRGDGLRGSWGIRPGHRGQPPDDAKRCVTHLAQLEVLNGATLVGCRLETGRQHQIRIHVSEAGHPLVGESVYIRDYAGPRIEAERPMLHATVLGLVHPRTGRYFELEDPAPADFQACRARLRLRDRH
jgi:23S rRNA pseudouridine1911/1915/1917 synthase